VNDTIANLATETRRFTAPAALAAAANVSVDPYADAAADRLGYWAKQPERITWTEPFIDVLDWSNPPFARWFADRRLNVAYNCVDRHVQAGDGDRVGLHFVGEPGDTRDLTHADLQREVSQAAHARQRSASAPATGSRCTCR
jgi:acetyl-CoA synthetase